jgi:hypothetical protein
VFQFVRSHSAVGSWPLRTVLCDRSSSSFPCILVIMSHASRSCIDYAQHCASEASKANLNSAVVSSSQFSFEILKKQYSNYASHCGNCRHKKYPHSFAAV